MCPLKSGFTRILRVARAATRYETTVTVWIIIKSFIKKSPGRDVGPFNPPVKLISRSKGYKMSFAPRPQGKKYGLEWARLVKYYYCLRGWYVQWTEFMFSDTLAPSAMSATDGVIINGKILKDFKQSFTYHFFLLF